jgi:hypothetical protein
VSVASPARVTARIGPLPNRILATSRADLILSRRTAIGYVAE